MVAPINLARNLIAPILAGNDWSGKRSYTIISKALFGAGMFSLVLACGGFAAQQKEIEIPGWLMSAAMGVLTVINLAGSYAVWRLVSGSSDSAQQLREMVDRIRTSGGDVARVNDHVIDVQASLQNLSEQERASTVILDETLQRAQQSQAMIDAALQRDPAGGRDAADAEAPNYPQDVTALLLASQRALELNRV